MIFTIYFIYVNVIIMSYAEISHYDVDGLVQERRNSIADALELHLSWT